MSRAVRAKLAPPPKQWTNCCVPVDVLLETTKVTVRRRKLVCSVMLFIAYVITLFVCLLSLSPTQELFMSNAREVSDIMFWNEVLVPQTIVQSKENNPEFVDAQWSGKRLSAYETSDWRQYEVWTQTRMLYSGVCAGAMPAMSCIYPALLQQARSTEFSNCIPWSQSQLEDDIVCLGGVTSNCQTGVSTNPGTCNANQPYRVNTNPGFPFVENEPSVCPVLASNVLYGCSLIQSCGWSNTQVFPTVTSVGKTFNANPKGSNVTLDAQSRVMAIDEVARRNIGGSNDFFLSIDYEAQSLLSGAIGFHSRVLSQPRAPISQGTVVASGFLAALVLLEMLLFAKRLVQHPYSLITPWLVLDMILIAFYVILFMVLNQRIWNFSPFKPVTGNFSLADTCELQDSTNDGLVSLQLMGALLAMSFITIFRFMTVLRFSRLALHSLMVAFQSLVWAFVIIAIVYLLNAAACLVFFGPNAYIFRQLGGSFFTTLVLPEGFDVSFIAEQMKIALGSSSPIPGLYFTLVVFVINRCVTAMVTALVAVSYIATKHKEERAIQHLRMTGSSNDTREDEADNSDTEADTTDAIAKRKGWRRSVSWSGIKHFLVFIYEQVTGNRSYETVDLETAWERLVKWSQHEENIFKSFITFEEVKMVISIIDDTTRVKVTNAQVRDFFKRCGPVNIYWIDDARNFERVWMDAVNLEGGKGERYKRRKAEAIAIQASRIADFNDSADSSTPSNKSEELQTMDTVDEITVRIKATKRLLESQKVKKVNLDQVLQPMMSDMLQEHRRLQRDIERFAVHFEVANILRQLGLAVSRNMFQLKLNKAESYKRMPKSMVPQDPLVSVDVIACRLLTSNDMYAVDVLPPRLEFDDVYREGLRQSRKLMRESLPSLTNFVRVTTDEWLQLRGDDQRAAYLYFLMKGAHLAVGPRANRPLLSDAPQGFGSAFLPVGVHRMPVSSVQSVQKEKHMFVFALLRHGERAEDDPRWSSLRHLREAAKMYDFVVKERACVKFFDETGINIRAILKEGEYLEELSMVESDHECYIVLRVERGLTLSYLEESSAVFEALERAHFDMSSNTMEESLIITEVDGERVRTIEDLARTKFSFRPSTSSSPPPRYTLTCLQVNARREVSSKNVSSVVI